MVIDALAWPGDDASTTHALIAAAKHRSTGWAEASPSEAREFLQTIVSRIVVGDQRLEIEITKQSLRAALLGVEAESKVSADLHQTRNDNDHVVRLTIAARLKRCGGEVRMIVPAGETVTNPVRLNLPIIKAIARACNWRDRLMSGDASSMREIAKEAGVDDCYVSRIVQCAFLAPDIVEAILDGRQPADLTLDKVLTRLPTNWADQRQRLGFTAKHR